MRTICLSKPVSELVLQTGLTRPRSWTEEVSDLGRGLFSFEFPAQIETSASRETVNNYYNLNTVVKQDFAVVEQVDGRVKSLESNYNVLVRKKFFPKKLSTGGGEGCCSPKKIFP